MTHSINYCSSLILPFLSNIHWQRISSFHIVFSFYDQVLRMDRYKILLILALVLAVIATSLAFLTIFNLCDDEKCGGTWYDKEYFNDRKIGTITSCFPFFGPYTLYDHDHSLWYTFMYQNGKKQGCIVSVNSTNESENVKRHLLQAKIIKFDSKKGRNKNSRKLFK